MKKTVLDKPRTGPGRPAFVPTDEMRKNVAYYSGLGLAKRDICYLVRNGDHPMSVDTLDKYFVNDMVAGKAVANGKVIANLFRMATGNDRNALGAAIFWAKTQCRWRETDKLDISIENKTTIEMSREELLQRLAAIELQANKLIEAKQESET